MKKAIALLLSLTAMASALFAQGSAEAAGSSKKAVDYPKKNITMICPWSAGGGTDAVLRALCGTAEKYLGVGITVENKTGGAGAIGHAAIKNAKPDGYTVGMITFELNSLPQQGLIDFTYADFDPLIRVNADAATLTVKADAPYNSVKEFVDYCKAHPGEVSIGNSAPGSVWHIGAGLLANSTGIDVKHVAFEGACRYRPCRWSHPGSHRQPRRGQEPAGCRQRQVPWHHGQQAPGRLSGHQDLQGTGL